MEIEKIFRTKTGFCHVKSDKIILTKDGVVGNISKLAVGMSVTQALFIYSILSIGLIYSAYDSYVEGNLITTVLFGLLGLYFIYAVIKSRNNSAVPIINRKDIKRMTFNPGTPGLIRPRFEVEFEDNGKIKKRLIMLPGTLSGGQSEASKAVQIMKDEKLLS